MILILVLLFEVVLLTIRVSAPPPPPPPPPPPAGSAGVKDPYVHLLESQSAMSMLMMQMAREMNQRSSCRNNSSNKLGKIQINLKLQGKQGGQTGAYQKEMKMDEKWIPALPVPGWKSWTSRGKELSGFKDWLEKFSGWLSLIHDAYGPELWGNYPCRLSHPTL